jgi:hypothetical protein
MIEAERVTASQRRLLDDLMRYRERIIPGNQRRTAASLVARAWAAWSRRADNTLRITDSGDAAWRTLFAPAQHIDLAGSWEKARAKRR